MPPSNKIPQHVAVIMDGNGRWAREKGFSRTVGHKEGIKRVEEITKAASDLGIKIITFFAFSTENWSRPKHEVDMLMNSLESFLKKQAKVLKDNNIRFKVIGRENPIPKRIILKIRQIEEESKDNTGLIMVLALNYGARQEIVDGVRKFTASVVSGKEGLEGLNTETFSRYLYTSGLPDPDLLIRTSGEMRLSNFMLWQLSYAEFYFSKKYWPDFHRKDLEEAIEDYKKRKRRFGGLDVGEKDN